MKIISSLTLLLALSCWHICAQQPTEKQTFIGVSQGFGFSRVDFSPAEKLLFLPGYSGGLFFTHISEPHVGIRLELNYVQKGWLSDLESPGHYSRQLSYFDVPFMTHIVTGKKNRHLIINVGPFISYLLDEKEEMKEIQEPKDYHNQTISRSFDFGFCAGLGLMYTKGIHCLGFEARYANSLTNIFTASSEIQYFSSRNQLLYASVFYGIRIFGQNKE